MLFEENSSKTTNFIYFPSNIRTLVLKGDSGGGFRGTGLGVGEFDPFQNLG